MNSEQDGAADGDGTGQTNRVRSLSFSLRQPLDSRVLLGKSLSLSGLDPLFCTKKGRTEDH